VIVVRFKYANESIQRDIKSLAKDDVCPYEDANGKTKTGKPLIEQRIFCAKRYHHSSHEVANCNRILLSSLTRVLVVVR
jgi:hypothetical protein